MCEVRSGCMLTIPGDGGFLLSNMVSKVVILGGSVETNIFVFISLARK